MKVDSISVLICTYNRARLLRETLAALQAQEPPPECSVEIIVVDNNSTDNTGAVVAESAGEGPFRVVSLTEASQGKSFALNTGLAQATGDVLALTDDDVLPAQDWLRRIVDLFRARDVSFVFGKVLPRWGGTPPPELLTPQAQAIWGPLAIVDYGDAPTDYLPDGEGQRLPIGANLAFARAALVAIGGWRTDLGKVDNTLLSGEDHEIFMRLRRAGLYRGYYQPEACVRHFVPAGRLTRAYFRRWFYWHGKTQALMLDDMYPELDFSKVPRIMGVPRFAIRQAGQQVRLWLRTRRDRDPVNALRQELYAIEYAGLFVQCWQLWRRNRAKKAAQSRNAASTVNASARVGILLALLGAGAASPSAAGSVQLSIRDGRVWLTTDRATIGEILSEWARVGQTEIANGDRLAVEPLTLRLDGVPEAAALELLLRAASGYVAVEREAARQISPALSRFAKIVVLAPSARLPSNVTIETPATAPTTMPAVARAPAAVPVRASPMPAASVPTAGATATAVPDAVETVPGVRRLIGADGLPVPDDQDNTPPPSPPRGRGGR